MVAVEVRVLVRCAGLRIVTPSAVCAADLVRHALFYQPVEGAVQGYAVERQALLGGELFDFLMAQGGFGFQQNTQHANAGGRNPATGLLEQFAGGLFVVGCIHGAARVLDQ